MSYRVLFSTLSLPMSESTPPQLSSMVEPSRQLSAIQSNIQPAIATPTTPPEHLGTQATPPTNAIAPPSSPQVQHMVDPPTPQPIAELETPTTAVPKPPQPSAMNAFDPRCPLTVEGGVNYLAAPQTWAERNPTALEQPPSRPAVRLTDAVKATKKITCEANKKAAALLDVDIEKFRKWQDEEIEKIAKTHSKKVPEIEALINHRINYKAGRLPSMSNALTHMQSKKMNAGTYFIS